MRRTPIYKGRIIEVSLESVELPNKHVCDLEIVRLTAGAASVAIDRSDQVCLLRQFRHAADGWLWELPAGRVDANEEPRITAERELLEEAGIQAQQWESLGSIISSPGILTEVVYLYLARELTRTSPDLEQGEVIEVHWLPLKEALGLAISGEIQDAKTLVGLFRAQDAMQCA